MTKLGQLVAQFVEMIRDEKIEIYNEFSLQHELGFFLRQILSDSLVQFERNVRSFFPTQPFFTKREIDISVLSKDKKILKHAIELKFPRNGQYPEQMFSFCKDVAFAEEMKIAGFQSTALLIFAEDPLFYEGRSDGIYGYFRGERPLHGLVQKPTGIKDTNVNIQGSYVVEWKTIFSQLKYALVEIDVT